mmetsp:Transcript_1848/g.3097  ORF Transcript_1848/g.3097 Transcript_1848/m.3097 type:complete len:265 (-) Transcript_1848:56-850(-)
MFGVKDEGTFQPFMNALNKKFPTLLYFSLRASVKARGSPFESTNGVGKQAPPSRANRRRPFPSGPLKLEGSSLGSWASKLESCVTYSWTCSQKRAFSSRLRPSASKPSSVTRSFPLPPFVNCTSSRRKTEISGRWRAEAKCRSSKTNTAAWLRLMCTLIRAFPSCSSRSNPRCLFFFRNCRAASFSRQYSRIRSHHASFNPHAASSPTPPSGADASSSVPAVAAAVLAFSDRSRAGSGSSPSTAYSRIFSSPNFQLSPSSKSTR